MFSLTRRERVILASVLLLFLLGWSWQTWRTYQANEQAAVALPTATRQKSPAHE